MLKWWFEIRDEIYDDSNIELAPTSYLWDWDVKKKMWCPVKLYKICILDSNIAMTYYVKDKLLSGCVMDCCCNDEAVFDVDISNNLRINWFDIKSVKLLKDLEKKERVIIRMSKDIIKLYEENKDVI